MKALFTGTISGGFSILRVYKNNEVAEDAAIKIMADGTLAEAVEVESPRALDKKATESETGENFVVYGKGIGNGFSVYGPFDDGDYAEEFAEDNRSDDDEWELFVVGESRKNNGGSQCQ